MYVTARGDSCETTTEVVVIDKKQKPISSKSLNSKRYRREQTTSNQKQSEATRIEVVVVVRDGLITEAARAFIIVPSPEFLFLRAPETFFDSKLLSAASSSGLVIWAF